MTDIWDAEDMVCLRGPFAAVVHTFRDCAVCEHVVGPQPPHCDH